MTARAFWESRAEAHPDRVALIADGMTLTYGELDSSVNRVANALRAEGVRGGTVVAALLPSSAELLRLQLALAKLGAVTVPLIAGSTVQEATYVIGHSGAELMITDEEGAAVASSAPRMLVGPLVGDDDRPPPESGIGPFSPHAIMYTSGSTGRPKGVVQPSSSLAAAGRALAQTLLLEATDNVLCALPLFHTAATHMAFGSAVGCGGRLTLLTRFSRETFWPVARESRATASYLFPAQMAILMTNPPSSDDADNPIKVCFSHVRNQEFCDRFGVDVCPGWAMTETCGMGTLTRPGRPAPGIGRPYPEDGEVSVRDEHWCEVADGVQGEIWFRHRSVMLGYHRDEENTTKSLREGWVGSGDLGRIDEAGALHYTGRLKHMIKRSGENIAGEEVEFTLMAHPTVEEAVVFAVPDAIRTEEVFAVVCVRRPVDPAELVSWCRGNLSRWKAPRYIELRVNTLPRLANGKVDRAAVIAEARIDDAWQEPGARKPLVSG